MTMSSNKLFSQSMGNYIEIFCPLVSSLCTNSPILLGASCSDIMQIAADWYNTEGL